MPKDRITHRNKTNKGQHRRQQTDGEGRGCMDNSHVTQMKNWWIMKSNRWLKFGDIKEETESRTVTAKNPTISTNYFKNDIMKEETDSKCQLCTQHEETTDHLTSGSSILVKNEYLMRHDKIYAHLHYSICKSPGIKMTDIWYTPTPTPVHECEDVTTNRLDVIIKKKKRNIRGWTIKFTNSPSYACRGSTGQKL